MIATMFSAVNSPPPLVLFGMVVSGGGFFSCVLAGVLRAALSSCRALRAFGVQIWLACCSILLGSKKGGSTEPPIVRRFALSSVI